MTNPKPRERPENLSTTTLASVSLPNFSNVSLNFLSDVAFKAGKKIDWDGMAKLLVTDEARREFFNLRRAFDEVNTQLETKFSQEPEPIDWEYYRKGIGTRLVDMYKQHYESIEIPKFVDTVTPQYKPKFDALLVELKEAEEKSLKESERLEKEIVNVQSLKKRISTMTADEYFAEHPELKKKFDDEIRNDNWGYSHYKEEQNA